MQAPTVAAYDPVRHALNELEDVDEIALTHFHETIRTILPDTGGTVITLVANESKTGAAYDKAESLVWRDAGCLLAILHLSAVYLDLGFCGVGLLGDALLAALPDAGSLAATGVAVVGKRLEPRS